MYILINIFADGKIQEVKCTSKHHFLCKKVRKNKNPFLNTKVDIIEDDILICRYFQIGCLYKSCCKLTIKEANPPLFHDIKVKTEHFKLFLKFSKLFWI